jgi:predicted signal transduction protein with EAL and GGDEF domain
VEIRASALRAQPGTVTRALPAFRERGMRIALDDFATAYSSLSHLRTLPLDGLKVDRCCASRIGASPGSSSLVKAVLSMVQALGGSAWAKASRQRRRVPSSWTTVARSGWAT